MTTSPATEHPATEPERFSPDWLALREHADSRARDRDLAARLLEHLAARRAATGDPLVTVHDLGCGTGSMIRWLAPRIPGPQRWILRDRDPDLLARALADLPAVPGSLDAEACQGDVTDITAADLTGTGLVTCSALLDLLTADEVTSLVAACAGAGAAVLFTLSVAGRTDLDPPHALDRAVQEAFNGHQRRHDGTRALLGPDATAVAAAACRAAGMGTATAPSPWHLDAREGAGAALLTEWLAGWTGAAREQDPALDGAGVLGAYLAGRLAEVADGRLSVQVHHEDLLALPAGEQAGNSVKNPVKNP